jgi:hypothetical protein
MVGRCEHGNEPLGFMQCCEYFDNVAAADDNNNSDLTL